MSSKSSNRKRKPRDVEPVEVELTVQFRFGDEPDDVVTPLSAAKVPMVNSVFQNRDRIVAGLVALTVQAGLASPKVVGQLWPILKFIKRRS
ncbi:hypothetical protein [Sinimarinibacterium sp. NLF-5-8]|uniref:hypothetical protein n=1 Tax=Sinimarinibacterium sp. NLF-5-8 TaxID=2698684 RepID=UPI00137BD211|nr:hypothetical protein [Sinimarinibacterium sp. NLF-5-8]QHS08779.1 hypothetical protein GT972_00585 [Sinimarinibacterium sp. NLF-5-8]